MTRELDEQVARAMELTPVSQSQAERGWEGMWNRPPRYRNEEDRKSGIELTIWQSPIQLPAYSTDYACLPEMLAWLHTQCEELAFWVEAGRVQATAAILSPQSVMLGETMGDFESVGATLPEAVAELVIAVGSSKP